MKKIAVFASGSGSNAQNIMEYFKEKNVARVEIVLSNKKDAYVLERAQKFNVPIHVFDREQFYKTDYVLNLLIQHEIDLIVLAGFLWLVPENLLKRYPNKIVNIHPALLPKYGGKGMYGDRVHESVVANKEPFSGITIHYINERYDEGDIIFQSKCKVEPTDSASDVANKVHALEYEYFPQVIEQVLEKLN
jgi:phosphoribosylglycinamide formyltransferase-1